MAEDGQYPYGKPLLQQPENGGRVWKLSFRVVYRYGLGKTDWAVGRWPAENSANQGECRKGEGNLKVRKKLI